MDNLTPTSTLGSMSFDILKMDGIDDPMIDVNKLATLDLEESYFATGVNYIKESNAMMNECKMELYKSISKTTEQYVILEAFSGFFSKINDIIDKVIKFIKSLLERASTKLSQLVGDNKYIIKNKKAFSSFGDSDEFEINGYKFTFSENVPNSSIAVHFDHDLFEDIYNSTKSNITVSGVRDAISGMDIEQQCEVFRGDLLDLNKDVSASEYSNELFKVFRNGKLDTSKIDIDSSNILKIYDRFEKFKNTKSSLDKLSKRIESDYNNVRTQVKNISKRNGDLNMDAFVNRFPEPINSAETINGFIPQDLMIQIDLYTKNKCQLLQEYSNIHILAISAKLDALKECFAQDRATLYTALSKIQRTDSKRGIK